jgi:hypothetical protein
MKGFIIRGFMAIGILALVLLFAAAVTDSLMAQQHASFAYAAAKGALIVLACVLASWPGLFMLF